MRSARRGDDAPAPGRANNRGRINFRVSGQAVRCNRRAGETRPAGKDRQIIIDAGGGIVKIAGEFGRCPNGTGVRRADRAAAGAARPDCARRRPRSPTVPGDGRVVGLCPAIVRIRTVPGGRSHPNRARRSFVPQPCLAAVRTPTAPGGRSYPDRARRPFAPAPPATATESVGRRGPMLFAPTSLLRSPARHPAGVWSSAGAHGVARVDRVAVALLSSAERPGRLDCQTGDDARVAWSRNVEGCCV